MFLFEIMCWADGCKKQQAHKGNNGLIRKMLKKLPKQRNKTSITVLCAVILIKQVLNIATEQFNVIFTDRCYAEWAWKRLNNLLLYILNRTFFYYLLSRRPFFCFITRPSTVRKETFQSRNLFVLIQRWCIMCYQPEQTH